MNLPQLQIRLCADVGKLPASIAIALPVECALSMIRRRLAIPVGNFDSTPDFIVDEEQIEHAGIPWLPKSHAA